MIDITKLLTGEEDKNSIRYDKSCKSGNLGVSKKRGPVIAWNITGKCNFRCSHCYSNSSSDCRDEELSLEEVKAIIDEFASIKVPVILLSGGEPLMRTDIFEIIEYAKSKGIKSSLSTNGSLIDDEAAKKLRKLNMGYVGISLDGIRQHNDVFRGVDGAYDMALRGIRNCIANGQKVGLRFTLNKKNYKDIPFILDLMEREKVSRICFYHLVPSGRGKEIEEWMLSRSETREVLDLLIEYSKRALEEDRKIEILTVANHSDGPYIYMKQLEEDIENADATRVMLERNGGNRSGKAIANMDWKGNVYIDQFTRGISLGNAAEDGFANVWSKKNPLLEKLSQRKDHIKGRCRICKYFDLCGGNLRARAFNITGDFWESDPCCVLEDSEI